MRDPGELRQRQGENGKQHGCRRDPFPPAARPAAGLLVPGMREKSFTLALRLELGLAIGQHVGHFAGRLEAVLRLLGVQLGDDVAQPLRHFGNHLADRPRVVLHHALQHRRSVVEARNGGRPVAIDVQHAAEAEQVGPVVERFSLGLLGGHVHRRAGDHAALGQAGVVGRPGQAEVGDLDPMLPAFEQHVARLDVAVDQVRGVGGGQPLGDLPADPHDLRHFQRAGAVEPLLQRLAGDELHHQVRQRLFLDGMHLHDILVANLGGGRGPRARTACGPATWRPSAGPAP